MIKKTFTLDEEAVRQLERAAQRLDKAQSEVVREAIRVYGEQLGRMSEEERLEKLAAFDRLVPRIPDRTRAEIDRELKEIREARRGGGRRSQVE